MDKLESMDRAGNERESKYRVGDMLELSDRLKQEELQRQAYEKLAEHGAKIVMSEPMEVRIDKSTGDPAAPMFYVQGLGGDEKLPFHVKRLSETGQRQVIALSYGDRLTPERNERIISESGDEIPGVYQDRAEDLELMLVALGLDKVDIAAQSVGAPTAVIFAESHPDQIGRLALIQPGGIDLMTPRQRKIASAREAVKYLPVMRRRMAKENKPAKEELDTFDVGTYTKLKNTRQQRRDILSTRMREAVAGLNPNIQVAIAADKGDAVFPAEEVYAGVSGMPDNVWFIATDWKRGAHGLGYSDEALTGVNDVFLQMEQDREDGVW